MNAAEWLFEEEFEMIFKKIGGENWEDLRQEIAVIVLEYDRTKMNEIVQRGKNHFKFWVVRSSMNTMTPVVGKFFRLLNQYSEKVKFVQVEDISRFSEKAEEENEINFENINKIKEKLNSLHFYDKGIFELYLKHGSLRRVSEIVGIPHTSIFYTIKKVQKCLKQSLS